MQNRNKPEGVSIGYILDVVSRNRWFLIIPFMVIVLVGIVLAFTLPKMYEAKALILVRPQKVARNFVQTMESANIDSRINTISQQIMSRSNLEKIINRFGLFSNPGGKELYREEKIALLRKRITVEAIKRDKRAPADAFSIAFRDRDPRIAMQVTNAFANYVIDENLKARQEQTVGTAQFLEEEQAAVKKKLERYERALKEYRQKYMGGLPEQLDANLRTLDRLQNQLIARQESLRDARNRLAAVENLIAEKRQLEKRTAGAAVAASAGDAGAPDEAQTLDQLKERLAGLRTRYTDKHPDIVRLKNIIARLEANPGAIKSGKKSSGGRVSRTSPGNPELDPYLVQRTEIQSEIESLSEDIASIKRQVLYYQRLVEDTPRREQELQALKRDYDEIRDTYRSLLERKLEADIAVNMEKKQKGEQFVIIDPAVVPEMPVEPDLKKLFAMVLVAAIGVGGGLVFLREYMDGSFRRPKDVETFLNVPLLAEVPVLTRTTDNRKKRLRQSLTYASIFLSVVFLGSFAVITFKGVEPVKEYIKKYIAL